MLMRSAAMFPFALLAAPPLLAQEPQEAGAPAKQVGPRIHALVKQDSSVPPATALAAATLAPPPIIAAEGSMWLSDVVISGDARVPAAKPLPGWRPNVEVGSGLVLNLAPGSSLDAAWVKASFAANRMLGAEAEFDRITALVQLINLAYVSNGYPNTGILIEGRSENGVLHLRLVTGRLVATPGMKHAIAVSFRGGHSRGLDADYIRHRLPGARSEPLNIRSIERDFRLLSDDVAIRTLNANLLPGPRPGEASLVLEVVPQPQFDLYTTYANNRSPSVGARRLGVAGSIRSFHQPGDLLSLAYGTTRGLTDFSGSYVAPLFSPRWLLSLRGGFNNASVVDRPLLPLNIRSKEYSVEGGVSRTLISRAVMPGNALDRWKPAMNATVGVVLTHRKVLSSLLGTPFSFSPGSEEGRTEYNALRLTFDFTKRSRDTVFAASFIGSLGLGGTRSTPAGTLTPSPHFTSAQLQLNYARRISPKLLELRLRFAGQLAGGLLYSPERFSIGGSDTVRGYRESLLLADTAAVGSVELAQPFDLAKRRGGVGAFRPGAFTLSVFADGAYAHNRLGPQPIPKVIASVGARLAWTPASWLAGTATFGQALRKVVVVGNVDVQDRGVTFLATIHPLGLVHALSRAP